jgi:hypothetical protein
VSLAPELSSPKTAEAGELGSIPKARSGPGQPTDQMWQSQAALLQLVSLLGDEPGEWEDQEATEDEEDEV